MSAVWAFCVPAEGDGMSPLLSQDLFTATLSLVTINPAVCEVEAL